MTQERRLLLWTLGAWLGLLLSTLGSIGPWPVDETRYLGVGLEMWQRGDLLVPYSNGAPYPHKPPLFFWLMQLGWAVFGVNAWWPRVAVSLCALGAAGLTWRLARRLWPKRPQAAALAPVVLLGSLLWAVWMSAIMFDAVLALWVLVALNGLADAALANRPSGWPWLAAGLGLGLLTKGPVALLLVLPPAVLAPLWHPQPPPWQRWYGLLARATVAAAVIALLWALPAASRGGGQYSDAIFWGQTAGRVVDSFAHRHPVWWYLPLLLAILFPWTLWPSAWRALRRLLDGGDWGVRLLLCWIIPVFVAFSLISGKQAHYLLPLVPGFALLLARALEPALGQPPPSWRARLPVAALPLALALAVLALPWISLSATLPGWVELIPTWVAAAAFAIALLLLWPYRRAVNTIFALASATVLLVMTTAVGILRPAQTWYDLAPAAALIAQAQAAGHPVAHQGKHHNRFRFAGRLTQPVLELDAAALADWSCQHPDGLVVTYSRQRSAWDAPPAVLAQRFRGQWLRVVQASSFAPPACRQPGMNLSRTD